MIGLVVFALIFCCGLHPSSGMYRASRAGGSTRHDDVTPWSTAARPTLQLFPLGLGEHPFGQDRIGRDTFRHDHARRPAFSVTIMFLIGLIGGLIGVVVGAHVGLLPRLDRSRADAPDRRHHHHPADHHRGRDGASSPVAPVRRADVSPAHFLRHVPRAVAGPGWPVWCAREFLSLREREFVDAARIAGASTPGSSSSTSCRTPSASHRLVTLSMSAAILLETGLSLPRLRRQGRRTCRWACSSPRTRQRSRPGPWLFWWPGMFIVPSASASTSSATGCATRLTRGRRSSMPRRAKAACGFPSPDWRLRPEPPQTTGV